MNKLIYYITIFLVLIVVLFLVLHLLKTPVSSVTDAAARACADAGGVCRDTCESGEAVYAFGGCVAGDCCVQHQQITTP